MSEFQTAEQLTEDFTKRLSKMAATPEIYAQREADAKRRKEEEQKSAVRTLRDGWGAPARHAACKPSSEGEWGKVLERLKAALEPSTGRMMALVGGRGSGKTQLAVECMRFKTGLLKSCRFTSAVEFFIQIKSTYRKDADRDEMEVLKEFQKPKLLVIDEIGKRGASDWENTMLFELLNRRYNDMNDTILIDNRSRQEFTEAIGPSLASRMGEGGGIIECNWPSFRS